MLIYSLIEKVENPGGIDILYRIIEAGTKEAVLIIDEKDEYFIERWIYAQHLFYVHHRCGTIFKICAYKKKWWKKGGNEKC